MGGGLEEMGRFPEKGCFPGSLVEKKGFSEKTGGSGWKLGFWGKNRGFFEKWGFPRFLVNKSGKSREEPGI